jgi:hypothetical protein
MNWDMKKLRFFVQSTEKSTKRIQNSFSHTGTKNKEKKKPSERRCTVKKGMEILKGAGAKSYSV